MADYTAEQFEQMPEFIKGEFEQVGEVYRHKTEGKVATLKQSLDQLDGKLKDRERSEAEKLRDAEQKALERLKKEGKTDEIIADYEKRLGETQKQYDERINKMVAAAKKDKRSAIVANLAEMATDSGRKAFSKLVEERIDYDPESGKTIFLNEDGSASSLDYEGFKAEIQESDLFQSLIKTKVNSGGYSQGNHGGGGASKIMRRSEFEALNAVARAKFMKDGGKLTN